jgi:hypothetical protein
MVGFHALDGVPERFARHFAFPYTLAAFRRGFFAPRA